MSTALKMPAKWKLHFCTKLYCPEEQMWRRRMWPWRREFASGNTPHRTVGNANWIHPPAAQPAVANESRLLEPSPPPGTQGSVPRLSAGRQSEFGHFWVTAWWPRSSRTPGLSSFLTGRARSCTPTSQSAEALGRPVCWYKRVGSS